MSLKIIKYLTDNYYGRKHFFSIMNQILNELACNDTRCEVVGEHMHEILQLRGHPFHKQAGVLYKKTSAMANYVKG